MNSRKVNSYCTCHCLYNDNSIMMMRLSDRWLCGVVLALAVTHSRADCCPGASTYTYDCYRFIFNGIGGIRCSTMSVCPDCTRLTGWYCGRGSCNIFGCNCDGGCRQRPPGETGPEQGYCDQYGLPPRWRDGQAKRRLMASGNMTDADSMTTDDMTVSPFSASIQACLDGVLDKYNTSSLTEPQEIRDWLRCFDTDANSMLSSDEICSTLNCTVLGMTAGQIMSQMDTDGDGSVTMAEFDSDLQSYGTSSALPMHGVWSMIGLWMTTMVISVSSDAEYL